VIDFKWHVVLASNATLKLKLLNDFIRNLLSESNEFIITINIHEIKEFQLDFSDSR
jgi:hypothetical protein